MNRLLLVVMLAGCAPGQLEGGFSSEPFELRATNLWLRPGRFELGAYDRATSCNERIRSAQFVQLFINFSQEDELPKAQRYEVHTLGGLEELPYAHAQAGAADGQCFADRVIQATGTVEVLRITQDSRTKAVDAEVRIDLDFEGRKLTGTLTANECTSTSPSYCPI